LKKLNFAKWLKTKGIGFGFIKKLDRIDGIFMIFLLSVSSGNRENILFIL